jgi:hypothetical protein
MKADQQGIPLVEAQKREDKQLMNIIFLMGSVRN